MALWSAALFGHYKPKVDGWERRAEPGDIIAVRPYSEHGFWTPTERKEFLIVTIDNFNFEQLNGLVESQWDTDSYPVIPDDEIKSLINNKKTIELHPTIYIKKRRFYITMDDLQDAGVNIDKMLDNEFQYSPEIDPITKIKFYDKLKKRYADNIDGFNTLTPIKIGSIF